MITDLLVIIICIIFPPALFVVVPFVIIGLCADDGGYKVEPEPPRHISKWWIVVVVGLAFCPAFVFTLLT